MQEKDKNKLISLLIKSLPKTVNASNEKGTANFQFNKDKKRLNAIMQNDFVKFNSEERITFMIFDIDYIDSQRAVDVCSLEEMVLWIDGMIGVYPTYVLKTEKGYHAAFHLKNAIFTDNKKQVAYFEAIRRKITAILNADTCGSNRGFAIWRNPLKHPCQYTHCSHYELSHFKSLLSRETPVTPEIQSIIEADNPTNCIPKYQSKKIIGTLEPDPSTLSVGNRNNILFRTAVNYALTFPSCQLDDLQSHISRVNSRAVEPLKTHEVNSIVKYVYKRKMEGTLFMPQFKKKNVNLNAMNFEKMCALTYGQYIDETKRRQRLSAERTNSIRTPAQKQQAMDHARKAKSKKLQAQQETKIKVAIKQLNHENKKLTIVNIAKLSNLARRTVQKYAYLFKPVSIVHANTIIDSDKQLPIAEAS